MNTIRPASGRSAFTIIELLVVISIIGILAGMLLPTLSGARTSAHDVRCKSNLKQIGAAFEMYLNANEGYYPCVRWGNGAELRWPETLAPYIGGSVEDPTRGSEFATGNKFTNNVFKCPAIGSSAAQATSFPRGDYARTGSYGYNWMTFGPPHPTTNNFGRKYPVRSTQIAAPSRTILVADSFGQKTLGADPHAFTLDPPEMLCGTGWGQRRGLGTEPCPVDPRHDGKFNAVFADGHVESLTMQEAGYSSDDPTGVGTTGDPTLWNGYGDPNITRFTQ